MAGKCAQKICALFLVFFVTFPVLSQVAVGGQDQAAQHARQAQQYLTQQRPDLAIPEFKAVVDLDPKNLDAQAIEHYNAALRLQPDDAEAEFGLAKTLIAMNQQAKALPSRDTLGEPAFPRTWSGMWSGTVPSA